MRRVHQSVDAAIAFEPDAVVIIDSPEFTHPIARRIRKRAPQIPIIDYVSPSVWAWRPGRARKMRAYIDEVLAPTAVRTGGARAPRRPALHLRRASADRNARRDRQCRRGRAGGRDWGSSPTQCVLLVLPGSRRSEVDRLIGVFGDTVARLKDEGRDFVCIIPALPHVRAKIEEQASKWPCQGAYRRGEGQVRGHAACARRTRSVRNGNARTGTRRTRRPPSPTKSMPLRRRLSAA